MKERSIYRVTLVEPFEGETEYYFTTQKAIYNRIPGNIIGLVCTSLWRAINENGGWYENEHCAIKKFPLYGKPHSKSHNPFSKREK